MARSYSPSAAALACLALVAGIAAMLTLTVRHDGARKAPLIEVRIPVTWSQTPRPP